MHPVCCSQVLGINSFQQIEDVGAASGIDALARSLQLLQATCRPDVRNDSCQTPTTSQHPLGV